MATLATACENDGVLGMVAPLALAAAAGTALVVDLDRNGPSYPGSGSLADLVDRGPRLADLKPNRRGVAVLRNGDVDAGSAGEVVNALIAGWPHVVLRLPPAGAGVRMPLVPIVPLLPGGMTPVCDRAAVYQQLGWRESAPGPVLTLPTPSRATIGALLTGRIPARSRWIKSWKQVWEIPWE